jgi:hypothetical protein
MGKSAAQGALHDVIVHHGQPRIGGELCGLGAGEHDCIRPSITKSCVIEDSDNNRGKK